MDYESDKGYTPPPPAKPAPAPAPAPRKDDAALVASVKAALFSFNCAVVAAQEAGLTVTLGTSMTGLVELHGLCRDYLK